MLCVGIGGGVIVGVGVVGVGVAVGAVLLVC